MINKKETPKIREDGLPWNLHCGVTKLRHRVTGKLWLLIGLASYVGERKNTRKLSGIELEGPNKEVWEANGKDYQEDYKLLVREFESPDLNQDPELWQGWGI